MNAGDDAHFVDLSIDRPIKLFTQQTSLQTREMFGCNPDRCHLSKLMFSWYKTEMSWPESASELYRTRNRRLLAKLVPTFVK
jgi:hypothetical protein